MAYAAKRRQKPAYAARSSAALGTSFTGVSLEPLSAVDLEDASVQIVVREDELHGRSDLVGLSEPPGRNSSGHLLEYLGLHAGDHFSLDETGRDRIDAYLMSRELLGPHDRQRSD